jgi:hypothetical protein
MQYCGPCRSLAYTSVRGEDEIAEDMRRTQRVANGHHGDLWRSGESESEKWEFAQKIDECSDLLQSLKDEVDKTHQLEVLKRILKALEEMWQDVVEDRAKQERMAELEKVRRQLKVLEEQVNVLELRNKHALGQHF